MGSYRYFIAFILCFFQLQCIAIASVKSLGTKVTLNTNIEYEKTQEEALRAAKAGDLQKAYEIAGKSNYPKYTKKLVTLVTILSSRSNMGMRDIANFISENNWITKTFQDEIEANLNVNNPTDTLLWFSIHHPASINSRFLFLDAKIRAANMTYKERIGTELKLRELWVNNVLNSKLEDHFRRVYISSVTRPEISKKLNKLIWNGHYESAKNLLANAEKSSQPIFMLKLKAASNPSEIPRILKSVGKNLIDDNFLHYMYIKYLLRNNEDKEALKLLLQIQPKSNFDKWWPLKRIAIKNAIREKQYKIAMQLHQNHGLRNRQDLVDVNWYAGFISLRLLNQPSASIDYLQQFFNNSNTANSKAQAAYWLYRAHHATGDTKKSEHWLRIACEYPGNFYGQLALAIAYPDSKIDLFKKTAAIDYHIQKKAFSPEEVKKIAIAARLMFNTGYKKHAFTLLKSISESRLDSKFTNHIAKHYISTSSYTLATTFAKYLISNGHSLTRPCYPTHIKFDIHKNTYNDSLYYAIMRQESDFDQTTVSVAGAVGLMQLMPETAKQCAKQLSMHQNSYIYSADANAAQGCFYLDSIMEKFDGNYVLSIAAYNAGIARVNKWIVDYGDIRKSTSIEDVIDWIEMIPFNETKLYVKKVIENMVAYGSILSKTKYEARTLYAYIAGERM